MTNFDDLQQYIGNKVEENCDLCKKPMGAADTFVLGKWDFHYDCYHIVLKRLSCLEDIIFSPKEGTWHFH